MTTRIKANEGGTMKHHDYMKGYKATNADLTCQGFKFELGKWYKHDGEVKLCKSGFHFCVHPSGPWNYYNCREARLFVVEARNVIEEYTPGVDLKVVCREIRLISEIIPDGHGNTGDGNTGHWNTGHRNTGDVNTGNRNTGDRNTGHWNTGNGNATNNSPGFFCSKEPKVLSFDVLTKLTKESFWKQYPEATRLSELLMNDARFDYGQFKRIPGWTLKKCKALHQRFIDGRKSKG